MQLCEENMRALYEATWGWDERKKRDELSHVAARFLLMYDMQGELVGFTHFRFTWDDEGKTGVAAHIYTLDKTRLQRMEKRWLVTFMSYR